MGQNNNIIERSINDRFFCAKCLRELDSDDRDVVKDIDENYFCDRECRGYFWKENKKLIEEVIGY